MNTSKRDKKKKGTDNLPLKIILSQVKKDRNLSVRAIAAMAEVGESVVQGWLNGSIPHDLQAVDRLAKALGMSFRKLLLGEEEPNTRPFNLSELFNEDEFFEGICKINIKRLTPKEKK